MKRFVFSCGFLNSLGMARHSEPWSRHSTTQSKLVRRMLMACFYVTASVSIFESQSMSLSLSQSQSRLCLSHLDALHSTYVTFHRADDIRKPFQEIRLDNHIVNGGGCGRWCGMVCTSTSSI